ncbi:MAG: response regulator [Caldithrix sp.]|nr:response regulator [Caldithrix sp.]
MKRILIVEDEIQMQSGLQDNLEFDGYEVEAVADGQTAIDKISTESYDLIILDVMLPEKSGFDVCKETRQKGINTPILMLSAKTDEIDKVRGLEFGADDYVAKPFSLRELLARVKALLRRSPTLDEENIQSVKMGLLEVDLKRYQAQRDGKVVSMTHKEFEILKYFLAHKNVSISREQLLNDVWGYPEDISSRTIDNFIVKLRQKMENDPAYPQHLITVHGVGYKYVP